MPLLRLGSSCVIIGFSPAVVLGALPIKPAKAGFLRLPTGLRMEQACRASDVVVAAAAGQQDTSVSQSLDSPPKRRRVDWKWECPACSNKHPTGPRLLMHMHKCCADLLPSRYDLAYIETLLADEQQHHHLHDMGVQVQQQGGTNDAEAVMQLLDAAQKQEHSLRMQALRLHFIDESKQQAHAGAEAVAEDDGDSPAGGMPSTSHQQVVQEQGAQVGPHAGLRPQHALAAAADVSPVQAATANTTSDAAVVRKSRRGSSGRTPVRTIDQLVQHMQLPQARVLKLLERAPRSIRLVVDSEPLQVVFEDDFFLAVSKPPGLRSAPVHRFMGGSAVNRMIGYLGAEPFLLHRIDMDTSGLLLAAKDAATASAVNKQFQDKRVSKAYLALCLGSPSQQQWTADGPIGQHPEVMVARRVAPDGQAATTHIQVLSVSRICPHTAVSPGVGPQDSSKPAAGLRWGPGATSDQAERVKGAGCCLVCCRPVTGRTHQIRVHMSHSGHPLLGDDVYGLQGPWISRQALHAACVTLEHPSTGKPITFLAPPPEDFAAAAAALGLEVPSPLELATLIDAEQQD